MITPRRMTSNNLGEDQYGNDSRIGIADSLQA